MIIGHDRQAGFLKSKFEQDQLSHVYLFVGPDEVGKKKVAIDFVKSINCNEKDCNGKCQNCVMIEESRHPDFLFVGNKENPEIQIAQIRNIQEFLTLKPYYNSFKAVVIDDAEKMNQEAQSCFLKTLEEPKGKTIIILVSSRPEMLLSTISSRCQVLKFSAVAQQDISRYLGKERGIDKEKADSLAFLSEGRPGRAIKLLSKDELDKEEKVLKEILKVCDSDFAGKFQYIKNLPEENFLNTFSVLKKYLRYVLLSRIGIDNFSKLSNILEVSNKFKEMPLEKLKGALRLSEQIDSRILTTNINQKLALEILLIEI